MNWRDAPRNGNILDQRGLSKPVRDTEAYRATRQMDRVRDSRGLKSKDSYDTAAYPEFAPMPRSIEGTVERSIDRVTNRSEPLPRRPPPSK